MSVPVNHESMFHYQELGDRINIMITPLNGKLRFDPTYHQQIRNH